MLAGAVEARTTRETYRLRFWLRLHENAPGMRLIADLKHKIAQTEYYRDRFRALAKLMLGS
jgi:hypothetical protein